jgi:hypothetical protein
VPSCQIATRLLLAFFIAWAAVVCCSLPAIGETPVPYHGQEPAVQRSNPEQEDPEYNGEDLTRPQRSFETRFLFQTSSGATRQTDRRTLLLRVNWKVQLDERWKVGLLGQVPIVNKATFDPTGSDRESGIGDSAFQAVFSRVIYRHWAFGFGARLVAPRQRTRWEAASGRSCQGSGCAIPCPKLGPTPISYPRSDTRPALPVMLRDGNQRTADCAYIEHWSAGSLVRDLLSKL